MQVTPLLPRRVFGPALVLGLVLTATIFLAMSPSCSAQEGAAAAAALDTTPVLFYQSAKSGPNSGWQHSPTKGAAITDWGKNLGSARGVSFITAAGISLTADSDYAEWAATTNPTTAKGFQRVTFWLNNSM